MMKVAYMGMDVHAGTTVLGAMNSLGEFVGNQRFETSEKGIVKALGRFPAKAKYLALEESTLAHWAAQVAKPHVNDVLVCDPRHNALIYGGAMKRDPVDTEKLCRLLRLGELKRVSIVAPYRLPKEARRKNVWGCGSMEVRKMKNLT